MMADKTKEKKKGHNKDATQDGCEAKLEELTATLQRVQAEFENYKKRTEKEGQDLARSASKGMVMKLLPVLDDFELALMNKDNKDDFIKGMELIYSKMFSMLEVEGLEPIEAKGKKFDPYKHEALLTEEAECGNDTVIEELQKGYMLNGKVLRHSKVKICKK